MGANIECRGHRGIRATASLDVGGTAILERQGQVATGVAKIKFQQHAGLGFGNRQAENNLPVGSQAGRERSGAGGAERSHLWSQRVVYGIDETSETGRRGKSASGIYGAVDLQERSQGGRLKRRRVSGRAVRIMRIEQGLNGRLNVGHDRVGHRLGDVGSAALDQSIIGIKIGLDG